MWRWARKKRAASEPVSEPLGEPIAKPVIEEYVGDFATILEHEVLEAESLLRGTKGFIMATIGIPLYMWRLKQSKLGVLVLIDRSELTAIREKISKHMGCSVPIYIEYVG
jgi:hypothetical protein